MTQIWECTDARLSLGVYVLGAIDPAERALVDADQADARMGAGDDRPLLGVPVAVKDESDVAGEVTTLGTDAYGEPAAADSDFVRRLRSAGAVIVGKTNLPELAIMGTTEGPAFGVTRNPWDLDRTPGGSSGGSGAAVAAGLVPAATASDGAGSIRIPAACCGLFGLKPTRGRVSLAPKLEGWRGMVVEGCVSRSVIDTALWLDVVSGDALRVDVQEQLGPERRGRDAAATAAHELDAVRLLERAHLHAHGGLAHAQRLRGRPDAVSAGRGD